MIVKVEVDLANMHDYYEETINDLIRGEVVAAVRQSIREILKEQQKELMAIVRAARGRIEVLPVEEILHLLGKGKK